MKTKLLLTAFALLLCFQFTQAQYFISASKIEEKTASNVKFFLNHFGWDTTGMSINGVVGYKITYNTSDVYGSPTVASGAMYVPQLNCNTMPLVSYQHGTVFDKSYVPSNNNWWDVGLFYSGNGYIVTLPDYLGLGDNPGTHPYVHWESEAKTSLDLIRAAREFLNDSLQIWDNNQLFLTGYSQGGHSAMAVHKYVTVNNLQSEFNIVGSAPMSGPYALYSAQFNMMFDGDSTYYANSFLPYIFGSYQMVYGNLYENYNEYYDSPYDSIIADWLVSGIHWFGDWQEIIPENFYDFMQDSVVDNMHSDPNHPFNIALRKNELHNWIPEEPVRMLYCGMDSMVFPHNSIMAQDTMIALGANNVQALEMDPNADHSGCFLPASTYTLEWFDSLREACVWTSLPSVKKQPEINIYPNPVTDIATFSSAEITFLKLYDMKGALITKRNEGTIDMTGMKPGIYFVIGFDKHSYPMFKGKIIKN